MRINNDGEVDPVSAARNSDSLYERCSWFYAICREHLFHDHSHEIAHALWPGRDPIQGTHLLELGCGPGFYACRFAARFPQIIATGVDLSNRLLSRAKSRAASQRLANCRFQQGDVHALPSIIEPADAIVISRLFVIVTDPEDIMREIFRILQPGGRCFIAEPTSSFRTRLPLTCMRLLVVLTRNSPATSREPTQAEVMSHRSFTQLVHSQPWSDVSIHRDSWYQYAVCEKSPIAPETSAAGTMVASTR